MTEAYPLHWPAGWPRTEPHKRKRASFGRLSHNGSWNEKKSLTIADALSRLQAEIGALGARNLVVSSNTPVRQDGLPYSNRRAPDDPGVAVYFTLKGEPHCMPCDRWDRVADNIAAIAKHIEATRGIARWGVADTKAMFAGFKALPAPGSKKPWAEVLGFEPGSVITAADVRAAFREKAKLRHPDHGGSNELMAELNTAYRDAMRAVGSIAA